MAFSLGSDSQTGNIYAVCQILCRRTYSSNAMATPFLETFGGWRCSSADDWTTSYLIHCQDSL